MSFHRKFRGVGEQIAALEKIVYQQDTEGPVADDVFKKMERRFVEIEKNHQVQGQISRDAKAVLEKGLESQGFENDRIYAKLAYLEQ